MKKSSSIFVIFYTIFALLGTTSCSPVKQTDNASEVPTKVYGIAKEMTLGLDEEALQSCFLTENAVYYKQEKKTGSSLMKRELTAQAKPVQLLPMEPHEVLQAFDVTGAGEVVAAVKCFGTTDEGETDYEGEAFMELLKTDETGTLLWRQEIPNAQELPFISHILVGSNGRIYASSQTELLCFEETGQFIRSLIVKGELIQKLAEAGEGKVAVIQYSGNRQSLTVYQDLDGKEVLQKDFKEGKTWLGEQNELYFMEADTLASYQWEEDDSRTVLSFTDCGIDASAVQMFRALGEESFLIGLKEGGSLLIRFVWLSSQVKQAEEKQDGEVGKKPKMQLRFAALNVQALQGSVVSFNQSHENCELIMKTFKFPDQEGQYNAYLASKDGPDIVEIRGRIGDYIRNDSLLDLTTFIEKSGEINWDDFITRLPEDIAIDGKIYALPQTMNLTVLACPAEVLHGKTSWTIEEYLDLLEAYPDAMSREGASVERVKRNILWGALSNGINGFIDIEAGKVFLDGEDFRSVLERIAALDVKTVNKSLETRAREGEIVLRELDFNSTAELQKAEEISGQELVLIGYPVSGRIEGERSSNHISYDGEVGIHSSTRYAEEAWEYVEAYFMGALKENGFFFTPGKAAFEEKLQKYEGKELLTLDENGNTVVCPAITKEQKEKVRNAFLEATVYGDEEYEINCIITEEAEPYFKGDKELDDVIRIIQNRVQLYLDENK